MRAELTRLHHSVWEALACRATPSLIAPLRSNGVLLVSRANEMKANHIRGQNIKREGETGLSKRRSVLTNPNR